MVHLVGSAVYDALLSRRDPAEEEMKASGAQRCIATSLRRSGKCSWSTSRRSRDPRPPSSATQTRGFAVAPPTKRRRRYPRRPPRPSPRPYPCRCRCRSSQRVRGFCRDITITKFLFFSFLPYLMYVFLKSTCLSYLVGVVAWPL